VQPLKRPTLEEKRLLPAGNKFVLPDADATTNRPPTGYIAIYQASLMYFMRFPLYEVILEFLNKYELAPM